jgi:hypothetical protein
MDFLLVLFLFFPHFDHHILDFECFFFILFLLFYLLFRVLCLWFCSSFLLSLLHLFYHFVLFVRFWRLGSCYAALSSLASPITCFSILLFFFLGTRVAEDRCLGPQLVLSLVQIPALFVLSLPLQAFSQPDK